MKAPGVETDLQALAGILVSMQEISGRKLGLSATARELPSGGKLAAAKKKAVRLLADSTECSCSVRT